MQASTPFDPEVIVGALLLFTPTLISIPFWYTSYVLLKDIQLGKLKRHFWVCVTATLSYLLVSFTISILVEQYGQPIFLVAFTFVPTWLIANLYGLIFMIYAIRTRQKHNKQAQQTDS